jgi:hypothetical protein
MPIDQVQANRRGFGQDQIAIDQNRDEARGVQSEVLARLVLAFLAIHEHQPVGNAHFFEQDVRSEVGVGWVVVKIVHGLLGLLSGALFDR